MAIEVEIPGVGIAEFPDGTPPEIIQRVLREQTQQKQGFFQRLLNPQREDLPEIPAQFRGDTPEQTVENLRRWGGMEAEIGQDQYGNPTVTTPEGQFYINRPGFSLRDVPGMIEGAKEVARDVAPFLAGGAATAPLRALPAMGVQAGIGAASETINQAGNAMAGEEVDYSRLATTPMIAAGGEGAARIAFRVLRPVFNRLLGSRAPQKLINRDGTLSDDVIKALKGENVPVSQLGDLAQQELSRAVKSGKLSPDEAERFNFFTRQGITPTRAQVTRSADDFQLQQEAAKRSTAVREALETQEGQISQAFDTRIRGTGGNAASSGSPVADAVLNKASQLDQEVSRLYQQAREALPGDKVVRFNRLSDVLRENAPQDQITNGLIRAIRGDLQARGLVTKNFRPSGRAGVDTAEEVRKVINSFYNSTSDRGRMIIRQMKEALDEDVLRTAGDDFFRQARQAKANFEKGLRPESLSKFDANQRSLVRDVLENKLKPDDLFDRAVLGKSWKASDLRELKGYLTKGSPEQVQMGTQAWNDLRAETLDYIKRTAFIGPEDAQGIQALSRDKLERALNRIGENRLEVLFNADERQFLKDITRLAKMREPVRGTQQGKGPSAQAIEALGDKLMKSLEKLPMGFGELIEATRGQTMAIEALANPTARALSQAQAAAIKGAVTTPGAASAVGLANTVREEN